MSTEKEQCTCKDCLELRAIFGKPESTIQNCPDCGYPKIPSIPAWCKRDHIPKITTQEVEYGEGPPPRIAWPAGLSQKDYFEAALLDRERQLKESRLREKELKDFVVLCEEKLDQRLQGQYTNEQIFGMLLKEARNLMLKHSIKAAVTGEQN